MTTDLGWLFEVLRKRADASVDESYTARLLSQGPDRVARKVGEEAAETIIAAMRSAYGEDRSEVTSEAADLIYHLFVLLLASGVTFEDVVAELERRHRGS